MSTCRSYCNLRGFYTSALVAFFILTSLACPVHVVAQDFETEVAGQTFKAGVHPLFSRNGNSYIAQDLSGHWQVVRNAFHFDESSQVLPDEFLEVKIVALSYYGGVFGIRKTTEGCFLLEFTPENQVLGPVLLSSESNCDVETGHSNVTGLLLFSMVAGSSQKLLLFRAGVVEEIWDSTTQLGNAPRLEGFIINDLNTIGFTVSSTVGRKKQFSSYYWVPGRGVLPLVLPKSVQKRAIIRDINNKNKYLLSTAGGAAVFDPAKRRALQYTFQATRLTFNGSPFTLTTLYSTDGTKTISSCFATGVLAGRKIEFAAINDERELVLVGSSPASLKVGKVIPFTVKGYPMCSSRRATKKSVRG